MRYKPVILLLIFLKAFTSLAAGTDTLKLFYDIGKYDLSSGDIMRISGFVDSLTDADTLKIIGHADYLGEESDNIYLSFDRAKAVKDLIISKSNGKNFLIITAGMGEITAMGKKTSDGEPRNRRVDLVRSLHFRKPIVRAPPQVVIHAKDSPPLPGFQQRKAFSAKIQQLANLNRGMSISFPEITFQPGRHYINPEAIPYVDTLVSYLVRHSNLVFEIDGHICCVNNQGDSEDYDTGKNGLSTNRAKAIYDYFAQNGISTRRMSFKGLGSSQPKVWPESSEHDRYLNRRVEILIVDK
jgi:outer membrane protein OmpA-like peptidoglycan-associated protein